MKTDHDIYSEKKQIIPDENPILLFDGVCNFCDDTVNRLIKFDKKGIIKYAALQSETGKKLLNKYGYEGREISTVVLISEGKIYAKSDAAFQVFKHLGGIWNLLRIFKIIPRGIRNAGYDWVARNRYRWFGKKDACMIPTPEVRGRFLA